jgi:hypothetical protein
MKHQEEIPNEGPGDPTFSEPIRRWLAEGDRLEAEVAAAPVVTPVADERSLRVRLGRLSEAASRHRLSVMACMGLLPFALFLAVHRGGAPAAPGVALVAVAAPTVSNPPLMNRTEVALAAPAVAPAAAPSTAPEAPAAAAETPIAAASRAGVAKPHHHHRHGKHHAARQQSTSRR